MQDIENIIDDYEDVLEVDDDSTAVDDMEEFIDSDHDTAEDAIFDTSEMPEELRSEIEEIEGSVATFETEFKVEDADGNNNAVIDPTADYIPEDFEHIEERMDVNDSVIEHSEVVDATANLNQDLSPREITGEPTSTPDEELDTEGNTPAAEPVTAEVACYGCGEEVGESTGEVTGVESDEVEEEYPKEEEKVEEIKDEEVLEETNDVADEAPAEEVEEVNEEATEVEDEPVEEESSEGAEEINTDSENEILVEMQDNFMLDGEDLEEAQQAAEEQVSEDQVDENTEEQEDAFANVSEMADVNVGDADEEPHFVHEGEEVRPGVTSESPEEGEAVSNESVDFTRFVDIAFKNRK